MKDISIKDKCLIVITICVVVLTINWKDIGRYKDVYNDKDNIPFMLDTKNGDLWRIEKINNKSTWILTTRIRSKE